MQFVTIRQQYAFSGAARTNPLVLTERQPPHANSGGR